VTVPDVIPETTTGVPLPVLRVAMVKSLLVQVPPPGVALKVVVAPTQTVNVPVITGVGSTVTVVVAVEEQPVKEDVAETEYVVVTVGHITTVPVVAPPGVQA